MALTNFSLPFGALTPQVTTWGATLPPLHPAHQLAANTNNLLYSPADHQQQQGDDAAPPPESDFYKNNPYAPPQLHQQQQQQQQQPIRQSYQYNSNNNNHNIQNNNRLKSGNTYLPPIPPPGARNTQFNNQKQQPQQQQQQQPQKPQQQHYSHFSINQQQQQQQHHQLQQQIKGNNVAFKAATSVSTVAAAGSAAATSTRTYGEGSYNNFGAAATQQLRPQPQQQQQQKQFYNSYSHSTSSFVAQSQQKTQTQTSQQSYGTAPVTEAPQPAAVYGAAPVPTLRTVDELNGGGNDSVGDIGGGDSGAGDESYPHRPPGFTRVQAGQGTRTQVHAVLDYDVEEGEEEEYYDEGDKDANKKSPMPTVTPIQGPIFLKNGTAPVVPLFSYPTLNNGSFVQIPIWWTALSVALGLDVRGDIIKGVPCIKRYHQLFCPTAGNSYPIDKIERFIDDNKALMRRMYGDFEMNLEPGGPQSQTKKRKRRFIDDPDIFIPPGAFPAVVPDDEGSTEPHAEEAGESYFGKLRNKRQANRNANKASTNTFANAGQNTGRVDACESKVEIVTPYWASNSAGKIRAIVNTQHFEQAIHQEVCTTPATSRCDRDCGCEQKYKWHRLLAYDPDNDCKGIFMDWFLFPSCCVCRCKP
ncbi:protein spaetzle 3 [Bactrocera dorsalis]|uniref:Protein spaetzle 3 n=1 Tax=Bactrocera dorsalis TaxID=27457 RepID=A0A8N4L2K4_BACDO|nr:protein spaetzle 3 [Bactrocera dorsalis]